MTAYIPALSLLVVGALLAFYIVFRLSDEQVSNLLTGNNVVLIASLLFFLLLVVHLFVPQSWMQEMLKVIAGVVAGAIAATKSDKKKEIEQNIKQVAIGEQIQQAARDINNIQSMLSKFEDSVINQIQQPSSNEYTSVVALQETESININYEDNADIREEYENIRKEYPDDFQFKPIGGEKVREWYNRKVDLFFKVPGAKELLRTKVAEIRESGWEVEKVSFDFSNVNVTVILQIKRFIPLTESLA